MPTDSWHLKALTVARKTRQQPSFLCSLLLTALLPWHLGAPRTLPGTVLIAFLRGIVSL